ncbi:MAG: MBL fold metallo-hydrolase [Cytophagales bacterium]|nr:MBL fold metallo-hydrolase [Cytophagales bacterium]
MRKSLLTPITVTILVVFASEGYAQVADQPTQKKYQAKAPPTQPFGKEAFDSSKETTIRWLGMGGFLINSRGTTLMVDPLLKGFDMPVMIDFPIKTEDVPKLDAILVTHSDNDHYSIPTNRDLKAVTKSYHSTKYVDSLMKAEGFPSFGHDPNEKFKVGTLTIKMVPVDHAWQNAYPGAAKRTFLNEDCTGFMIETPDGTIWAQGDSRLMPEHLTILPVPDAILFDFSDSEWHFTFEGAVKIANAYPNTPLLLCHWGSVDAPDFAPFNGDPEKLKKAIINPERIHVLAPGQPYKLTKLRRSLR